MSQDSQTLLQIQLLGGFTIVVDGHPIAPDTLRLRAARQLIKLLALALGYRLHREQVLAAILHDQEPAAALNSLNQALSAALRALAVNGVPQTSLLILRDLLLRRGDPDQVRVDVVAFDTAARRARQQRDLPAALAALDLYRGDLLPDDPYDSWIDVRRTDL